MASRKVASKAFTIVLDIDGTPRVIGPFRTYLIAREYARFFYGASTGPGIDIVPVDEPSSITSARRRMSK